MYTCTNCYFYVLSLFCYIDTIQNEKEQGVNEGEERGHTQHGLHTGTLALAVYRYCIEW